MIRHLVVAAALLTPIAPALAQTHEAVSGALSGRSPHTIMRPVAQAERTCAKLGHHLPAGKLHTFGAAHADCDNTAALTVPKGKRTALAQAAD